MAPKHHGPAKGGNIKKGICQNHSYLNPDTGETGDCPKCASGEVMSVKVQKLSDFRCPVCEGKLTLVKESNTKKIALIAGGGVVAAAAVVMALTLGGGDNETTEVTEPEVIEVIDDTTSQIVDTVTPVAQPAVEEPAVETPAAPAEPRQAGPKTVLGGTAVIITEGSYKTIRFNRDYDLDLGKSDGSVLHIRAGEEINNAHITHGKLRGGNYRNSAGDEQGLHGLNVTL